MASQVVTVVLQAQKTKHIVSNNTCRCIAVKTVRGGVGIAFNLKKISPYNGEVDFYQLLLNIFLKERKNQPPT